jgi:hypothetical protein
VHHAASYRLLLSIIGFLIIVLGDFYHVLEIKEATEGISVCLGLHHGQGLFVVSTFTMNWASSDMHLLRFVIFQVVLVLHMLELLEIQVFLLELVISEILGGLLLRDSRRWSALLSVDVLRLYFEVFLVFRQI